MVGSGENKKTANPFLLGTHTRSLSLELEPGFFFEVGRWPGKSNFLGLAYQGKKDIVFRFFIEYYSSLRDFGPY
jgi:hypothetical protein